MLKARHQALKAYLATGELPTELPSTPPNFRREASHYELGSGGILKRDGKVVALHKDKASIFACFHATHSGNLFELANDLILGRDIA